MDRGAWRATVWGCKKLGHSLASKQQLNNIDMNIFWLSVPTEQITFTLSRLKQQMMCYFF